MNGYPFDLKGSVNLNRFADGTSNTIMIVEAGESVGWTSPEDIAYDPKKLFPKLISPSGNDIINIALCDGSVRAVNLKKVSEKTLRGAVTHAGGEILGRDW